MTEPMHLSFREQLGEGLSLDYLLQVVHPALERAAAEGKLSAHQLRKLADITSDGVGILHPSFKLREDITLNTLEGDGYLGEALLQLPGLKIRNFIKGFSRREDYRTSVNLQGRLFTELQGTEFEGAVPAPEFRNKRRRILISPFVEGESLKDVLQRASLEEKDTLLKRAIDDYAALFLHLNSPAVKKRLKFPEAMQDAGEFFSRFYQNREYAELNEAFQRFIAGSLNEAYSGIIHGDLHPRNIIVNGKSVYLDWSRGASNGFPEFDIGKLLTKADLNDPDLEERLAEYAASKLYPANRALAHSSVTRFYKNQIAQGLISAMRYIKRSKAAKTPEGSKTFKSMANVVYNETIRRTMHAARKGLINREFLDLATDYKNHPKSLDLLSDRELAELKQACNPDALMSQENTYAFDLSQALNTEENSQKSLARIKESINVARRKRRFKLLAWPLAAALTITGLFAGNNYLEKERVREEEEKVAEEQNQERGLYLYRALFSYEDVLREFAERDHNYSRISVDSPEFAHLAISNGVPTEMLKNMIQSRRIYAGVDFSSLKKYRHVADINVILPKGVGSPDPERNLAQAAEKLRDLIKVCGGDTTKAMLNFWDPKILFKEVYGTWYNTQHLNRARTDARKLAYNSLYGLGSGFDVGIHSIYLQTPPENFPWPEK